VLFNRMAAGIAERTRKRASCPHSCLRTVGHNQKPVFAITTDYVLAPVFSDDDLLIEISIQPKSDTHGQDAQRPAHLSQSGFRSVLVQINSIRPLGRIEEDYSAKFVIGGRAWGTLRYQNGYLQTAELIGHAPPLPIAFTHTCTL
jgi:hypothetical protein